MSAALAYTDASTTARALHVLDRTQLAAWRTTQSATVNAWIDAQGFAAGAGSLLLLPGEDGLAGAVIGIGDPLDPYSYAHAPFGLPAGDWQLASDLSADARTALQLGWGLGSYRFDRYKQPARKPARLVLPQADAEALDLLTASLQVRDLVNTPTEHMGPDELEAAVRELAATHGAQVEVVAGDALLAQNFPAIHAVGRASHRAPRLIALRWGDAAQPHVALVGKGVCFDTGGLDIKPADGMRNMKKDMGGAAHALALAGLVMGGGLKVRLQVLVPAVENAVAGNAFRPGDVLRSRKGLSVEIGNTDAEGRLILGDALALASEGKPELIIDFATLTGAARVALGPDLPALFTREDATAEALLAGGRDSDDPVWRLPLHEPYAEWLKSDIADTNNAHANSFAGSTVAALFLDKFVGEGIDWAHFDTFAWRPNAKPGRPKGGAALCLRASWAMLRQRFG